MNGPLKKQNILSTSGFLIFCNNVQAWFCLKNYITRVLLKLEISKEMLCIYLQDSRCYVNNTLISVHCFFNIFMKKFQSKIYE